MFVFPFFGHREAGPQPCPNNNGKQPYRAQPPVGLGKEHDKHLHLRGTPIHFPLRLHEQLHQTIHGWEGGSPNVYREGYIVSLKDLSTLHDGKRPFQEKPCQKGDPEHLQLVFGLRSLAAQLFLPTWFTITAFKTARFLIKAFQNEINEKTDP